MQGVCGHITTTQNAKATQLLAYDVNEAVANRWTLCKIRLAPD